MRKNSGFSLGELLVTVAILVILMAVALPAVIQIQKNLRQKELDAKAEIIYVAAQNTISKLKTSGKTSVYQYADGSNGVGKIEGTPKDADSEIDKINPGDICYFTSEELSTTGSAASAIMDTDTVDDMLLNKHWVVEYNPTSAIIYAVFYSEDLVNCAGGSDGYLGNYNKYNELRDKENRLDDGARVGYYGGGSAASTSSATQMHVSVGIINREKLVATISCSLLPSEGSTVYPAFEVNLRDAEGNTYTKYYAHEVGMLDDGYRNALQDKAGSHEIDRKSMGKNGNVFTVELILDDLSSDGVDPNKKTRFADQYPTLKAGTALTITVTAMCPGNHKYTWGTSDPVTTNSLFADSSTGDTAFIGYARHLQNLDESSGVSATITKAKQISDIYFTDKSPAISGTYTDWYETYGEKKAYFNGLINHAVPNFEPIQNSKLQSYDGDSKRISKLTVSADSDAGLFAVLENSQTLTVSNVILADSNVKSKTGNAGSLVGTVAGNATISNVKLTGTNVSAANAAAGGMVGKVTGNATIEQCQVYLTGTNIKGKNNHVVWIQGNIAGGLIGTVTGGTAVVETSAASTVVGGHTYDSINKTVTSYNSDSVGGLIGSCESGSITIDGSYADCYLFGSNAGGLVGTSDRTISITSSYAAGFATFQAKGAGLVCGQAAMNNAYTVLCYQDMPENGWSYFSTAESGTTEKTYYNVGSISESDLANSSAIGSITLQELTAALDSSDFSADTTSSTPYNLMNRGLTTYPFPVLSALKHYGDWMADFLEGKLVYYEKYNNGKYGFYGANVESTLKDDPGLTVVGDGYGVVYQNKDDALRPSSVTITCEALATPKTLAISNDINSYYPVIGEDGTSYRVYPLPTELVNTDGASPEFYLSIQIGDDAYFFNPHFAKTVVENTGTKPAMDKEQPISVRTARHLYMMSRYYDTYADATEGCTFAQERNIDYIKYDWANYSTRPDKDQNPDSQAPIAGGGSAFKATYDGGYHWITNVNFTTVDGLFVGFIGRNQGSIENVVLTATYEEGSADNYNVRRSGNIQNNQEVYMGVLVGKNTGTIENCAVSGYYIAGSDGTIHAYENSTLYAGGLVGGNDDGGIITNCSADTPALRLSSVFANVYLGGFVGSNSNSGYIGNCYALGHIEVAYAKSGKISIAGFAGYNEARIQESYCATALTASGDGTKSFGFAPFGGQVDDCEYLNHGTYAYINHMYPFNFDACAGTSTTFSALKASGAGEKAVNSYNFQNTKTVTQQYPFRAVVQDESGNLVHYGDWLDDENMGNLGIFYWEHEEYGSNNGYHFTYLGTEDGETMGGTTLCNAHDDGGVITEYGYGYYALNPDSITLKLEDAQVNGNTTFKWTETGKYNHTASLELQKQMRKTSSDGTEALYYFCAFTTRTKEDAGDKEYLCLTGTKPNCEWTLIQSVKGAEKEYKYTVSPFFANAMSSTDAEKVTAFDGKVTDYSRKPGAGGGKEDNQYEIRSIQQLQYINWYNGGNGNTSTLVDKNTYTKFTYLIPKGNEQYNPELVQYWRQSHDLDGTSFGNFSPIAGSGVSTSASSYTTYLYAWFGGDYDGQSYKIMNVGIESNSFTVGLFGVTANATMKNIIMHSDRNTEIKRCNTSMVGAYSIGGMVGVAYDYSAQSSTNYIENCAISGYRIVDASTNQQGLGETNVGGLIGVANVNLRNCSAVTDISIECTHEKGSARYGIFIRVGGLTGGAQGVITNCYSGGSAMVAKGTLFETPNYNGVENNNNKYKQMKIYICGIAGSAFASNYENFGSSGVKDGSPNISNCYTYFQFPKKEGHIEAMSTIASRSDRAFEGTSSGWLTITNCYYFEQIKADDVEELYGKGQKTTVNTLESISYTKMSDGTLLGKLKGITGTGSVPAGTTGYHNVTTTEGSANVPINGKYSFPGSNFALEGKDYPFPAIIQQKDLTFSTTDKPVYAYVHYGDWPINGPYWQSGRDTMDIFADMKDGEYAEKTFYLNPNGENLGDLTTASFTCAPEGIAEIVDVKKQGSDGLYPVTIRALKTGTTSITFDPEGYAAKFSLEVTANINIDVETTPEDLKLKIGLPGEITLSAKSDKKSDEEANDYSVNKNTSWTMEASQAIVELVERLKNQWTVTRNKLGKVTLQAIFSYDYHGDKIKKPAYIDVLQPDTVGLSDKHSYSDKYSYDVAYLDESGEHVSEPYVTGPSMDIGNFFLYLDAPELKIENLKIESIQVNGWPTTLTDNVYTTTEGEPKFYIEWDEETADKNYQYLPGSIYVEGVEKAEEVELKVKVKIRIPPQTESGESTEQERTLSIKLPVVYQAVQATYQNGAEQNFIKKVSVGNHKLPTQSEAENLEPNFAIYPDKMLAGWKDGKDETVYLPGSLYDFKENVTFTAVWKDIDVTLYANGGTFEDGEEVKVVQPLENGKITLTESPKRIGYKFTGWNTKANGSATPSYDENTEVDVKDLKPEYTLYAQWESHTLTLINEGDPAVFSKDINGAASLPQYNSNVFTPREGYTSLDGWYTEPDSAGNRVKVLDAEGNVVEAVDGYSKKLEAGTFALELAENQTLYACWKKLSNRYVLTEELRDGENYLLVSTNQPGQDPNKTVAFGAKVNPNVNKNPMEPNQSNVGVTITTGTSNYIEKDMSEYSYAVFHCSDGGFLSNVVDGKVRYLNVKPAGKNNGGNNYQYALGDQGTTRWGYFGNNKDYYNRNVLYVLSDPSYPNIATDLYSEPTRSTNARRFTYMGRLPDKDWTANAFTVKTFKDELDNQNTDVFLYEQQYEYAFSTAPGGAMIAMYSIRSIAPAQNATLTLVDGARTVLSTAVPSGAAPVTGYTAPTRANSEWILEGWYTAKDETGTKVLNADGTVTGDTLSGDTILYACWTRETDVFVQTDTLEPDADYLLVLGSGEEACAVGQVGDTVVGQPVTVHEPGDGGYDIYDAETGDRSPVDSPYITAFSDQTVWHYAVDGEGNGMLTATDGSSRDRALWELAGNDISIYRRTAVRERSFEDEYLMLTMCAGTDCITGPVTITDGAWADGWITAFQNLGLENAGMLGWFDSLDGGVQVLDADGRFAAENVADYLKDGKWAYDGGSLTLYARTMELPEADTMDTMYLPTETEEDRKKRTPHQVRLDKIRV